jgi:hypothetical protein
VTALTYSAECYGTGHEPCDWTHDGPKSDLAARKHTEATQHATSTHARPA